MKRPVTMQEIAEELGLSRITVSSVINNKARQRNISEETIKRVKAYLKKRGYVPSRQALALRSGKRNSVGILYCGHLYSHLTEAFNRIISYFNSTPKGVEIVVVRQKDVTRGLKELIARGISRLIWIHTSMPEEELGKSEEVLGFLGNIDAIIYNYRFDGGYWDDKLAGLGVRMVGIDRHEGYRKLAVSLKVLKHTSIAVCQDIDSITPNMSVFRSTFEETGLKVMYINSQGLRDKPSLSGSSVLCEKILRAMKDFSVTAACFLDDEVAAFTMSCLINRGIKIPEELTVTGFDDLSFSEVLAVPLTTLRVPVSEMVDRVVNIAKKKPKVCKYSFEPVLVKRKSHAARIIP